MRMILFCRNQAHLPVLIAPLVMKSRAMYIYKMIIFYFHLTDFAYDINNWSSLLQMHQFTLG